jgi:cytochrome o ubiquinol oxidase subunit 2
MCADANKMCMSEMMMIDMKGGGGKESEENRARLIYDNRADAAPPSADNAKHDDHSMPGMDMGSSMKMAPGMKMDDGAPAQPGK